MKEHFRIYIYTAFVIFQSLHGFGQTQSLYASDIKKSQDTSVTGVSERHAWHFLVEPYLMFPSMSGTAGIGNLPDVHVCVPASAIFSHLTMGAMLYLEAHTDRFTISSDLFYASLKEEASGTKGFISGEATLKELMWEIASLYKVLPWLELGAGARVMSIQSGFELNVDSIVNSGPSTYSKSSTTSWVDPIIIARMKTIIGEKWILQLRADIGGFGIGSQLTWQLQPDIVYRVSKLFQLGLGYRVLSIDYNKGTGDSRFLYDMDTYGPVIKLGFNF